MSEPVATEADLDGDGINESVLTDADGDGFADTVASDTDGDGSADTFQYDTTGDGVADEVDVDTNRDGLVDVAQLDYDGDGFADVTISDTDGDGVFDTTVTDLDGDGVADVVEYDADGDGQSDLISIPGQTLTLDASGHVVAITTDSAPGDSAPDDSAPDDSAPGEPVPTDPTGTDPTGTDTTGTDTTVSGPYADDPYADYEPSEGYSDPPLGDGDVTQIDPDAAERQDDADNWFLQSENGFCVPASVAQIVAEYSDQGVSESVFVDRAIELGYLTYDESSGVWSGLTIQQGEDLLESFGVQATVETGSIETLDAYLDQGYNAIAYIDSSVVWEGDAPGALDHAVVVSSIENGMVYLNDPGTPDGQLEPVPVEVFEQAWSASSDQMIVTDNPDTGSTGTPGVGQEVYVTPAGASAGTIILPIVLSGDDVQAWHQLHG